VALWLEVRQGEVMLMTLLTGVGLALPVPELALGWLELLLEQLLLASEQVGQDAHRLSVLVAQDELSMAPKK
jgi:hypothetical protein